MTVGRTGYNSFTFGQIKIFQSFCLLCQPLTLRYLVPCFGVFHRLCEGSQLVSGALLRLCQSAKSHSMTSHFQFLFSTFPTFYFLYMPQMSLNFYQRLILYLVFVLVFFEMTMGQKCLYTAIQKPEVSRTMLVWKCLTNICDFNLKS